MCNSLSSSITGFPDSPGSTKEMSDSSDISIILPNKKTIDSIQAFPTRESGPGSGNQPHGAESPYIL